jgi:hypothetical protein
MRRTGTLGRCNFLNTLIVDRFSFFVGAQSAIGFWLLAVGFRVIGKRFAVYSLQFVAKQTQQLQINADELSSGDSNINTHHRDTEAQRNLQSAKVKRIG